MGSVFKPLIFVLTTFAQLSWACSSFQLNDASRLVCKSYDWHQAHGQVHLNPKGLEKESFLLTSTETKEKWTASHGSITFSQHGKEFPLGGMNDAGLTVEILWLDSTQYPAADSRPALNELQWIQYQLDSFKEVKEVVADVKKRRISRIFAEVHYFVCDPTECSVIEFINKNEESPSGSDLVANVITNSSYKESSEDVEKYQGFGGSQTVPSGQASLTRYARLATQLQVPSGTKPLDHAFALLKSVEQPSFSRFQIVYDPFALKVYFRAPGKTERVVSMKQMNFECRDAQGKKRLGEWLDFNTSKTGDVTSEFAKYDPAENKKLVNTGTTILSGHIPDVIIRDLAARVSNYPDSLTCQP